MDDGQAQADAPAGVGRIGLVIAVENVAAHLVGHADTVIGNGKHRRVPLPLQRNPDVAAVGGVFDGVAHQVVPHVGEELHAARELHRRDVRGEGLRLLPGAALQQQEAVADLLVQPEGRPGHRQVPGLQLGEQQGVVGKLRQLGGFAGDDLEVLLLLRLGKAGLLEQLSKAADGGQRGLELVGEGVDILIPPGADVLKLLRHAVEVGIGRGKGAAPLNGQPDGQIPVDDDLEAVPEPSEPAVEIPPRQQGRHRAEGRRDGQGGGPDGGPRAEPARQRRGQDAEGGGSGGQKGGQDDKTHQQPEAAQLWRFPHLSHSPISPAAVSPASGQRSRTRAAGCSWGSPACAPCTPPGRGAPSGGRSRWTPRGGEWAAAAPPPCRDPWCRR